MTKADYPELRRWPRLPISFPVFVRGVDVQGRKFKALATAYNVSAGGMLVAVSGQLTPTDDLSLSWPIPPAEGRFPKGMVREIEAHITRVENRKRDKLLGLKFRHPIT